VSTDDVPDRRQRANILALVVALHAGALLALLNARGPVTAIPAIKPTSVFDVVVPPPQVPPPTRPRPRPKPKPVTAPRPPRAEGAAAPAGLRARASAIVAPVPVVPVPTLQPVAAATVADEGSQSTQGNAPVAGPGTGAGGSGDGNGSGAAGAGAGGGGSGGIGTRPSLASRPLSGRRDYSRDMLDAWPSGGRVLIRVQVQVDGRATDCRVDQSSGNREIDQETCRLVTTRLRFRPARDTSGRPVVAWYGYIQQPVNF
jgi:periplasmic protein TonB